MPWRLTAQGRNIISRTNFGSASASGLIFAPLLGEDLYGNPNYRGGCCYNEDDGQARPYPSSMGGVASSHHHECH